MATSQPTAESLSAKLADFKATLTKEEKIALNHLMALSVLKTVETGNGRPITHPRNIFNSPEKERLLERLRGLIYDSVNGYVEDPETGPRCACDPANYTTIATAAMVADSIIIGSRRR